MIKEILKYPDPRLSQKAVPIAEITDEVRTLAADMAETMYAKEGLGLAAPQIGELCRMMVIDPSGPDKRENLVTMINPEIIESEGEITHEKEGCLSVPGYRTDVKRAERIKVRYLDLTGQEVVTEADDLYGICIQHELDHLDGVLFIDRISRLKRALYDKKVKKWTRPKKSSE